MKAPYLMMSTRGHGSMAFTDRYSVQWFCVEQTSTLSALLELMTSCEDPFLIQKTVELAHNMAHQIQVASYVLANGPKGKHCRDWDEGETSASTAS